MEFRLLAVLLLVLFIGLKLTNMIAWPWFWVLSPLWIPFVFGISLFILGSFCILFSKKD